MTTPPPRKLLDVVREVIRLKHYSYRNEQIYIDWIKQYLLYHDTKHPREMGTQEIQDFLTHVAVNRQVAASSQNQARLSNKRSDSLESKNESVATLFGIVSLPTSCTMAMTSASYRNYWDTRT